MSGGQTANPFLETLQVRRKLVLHIFIGVMLIAAAGAFLTLRYSASAVVALDPHSVSDEGEALTNDPVALAWAALTDKQILAIIQQFQLNSGMTRLRAQNRVFTYVRSNILLHELGSGRSEIPAVQISFTGPEPSTVVDVTNAIAQSLAYPQSLAQSPSPTQAQSSAQTMTAPQQLPQAAVQGNISAELKKSRDTLQLLSETHSAPIAQDELQKHFKIDADLQAARQQTVEQLAALDQQETQAALAASKERAPVVTPAPPNPEAIALKQQIKQVQAHLAELRQRYTDEYPEVQVAQETLAALEINLSRLPVNKPVPQPLVRAVGPTADEIRITDERDQILVRQQLLDRSIKGNENEAELLRHQIADSNSFAQDYAFEQQRYNTLLKEQQQSQHQRQSGGSAVNTAVNTGIPARFIVIQGATAASAYGFAVKPLFWILSVLSALFVACFSAFVAEQFNPMAGTEVTPRSLHSS